MFTPIDFDTWDHKEVFQAFEHYTYSMCMQMDITELYRYCKTKGKKFYPMINWVITKTVNDDKDYRFAKIDGQIGYFDQLNTSYTLRRNCNPTLFTHMVTKWDPNPEVYHDRFLEDKAKAEAEDRLYYYDRPLADTVDTSIMPKSSFTGIGLCIPARFHELDPNNQRYIPFTIVGKYYEKDGRILLPVNTNFHHSVNDGYHVEKFFEILQNNMNAMKEYL